MSGGYRRAGNGELEQWIGRSDGLDPGIATSIGRRSHGSTFALATGARCRAKPARRAIRRRCIRNASGNSSIGSGEMLPVTRSAWSNGGARTGILPCPEVAAANNCRAPFVRPDGRSRGIGPAEPAPFGRLRLLRNARVALPNPVSPYGDTGYTMFVFPELSRRFATSYKPIRRPNRASLLGNRFCGRSGTSHRRLLARSSGRWQRHRCSSRDKGVRSGDEAMPSRITCYTRERTAPRRSADRR